MSEELVEELDSQDQPTEEVVKTEEVEDTVVDTETEDYDKLKESNKRLFERTKKAEAELKEFKKKPVEAQTPQINSDALSRDEAILIAQGMEAEDLDELKSVAKAKGLPLLKAKDTLLFQAYLEKQEVERKKEKAKLSASKGSKVQEQGKQVSDMSRDEHMALFKEASTNIQ